MSPDNTQVWIIYHATPNYNDGWLNRKGRCQLLVDQASLPFSQLYPLPNGTVVPSGSITVSQPTTQPTLASEMHAITQKIPKQGPVSKLWQNIKERIKFQKSGSK